MPFHEREPPEPPPPPPPKGILLRLHWVFVVWVVRVAWVIWMVWVVMAGVNVAIFSACLARCASEGMWVVVGMDGAWFGRCSRSA